MEKYRMTRNGVTREKFISFGAEDTQDMPHDEMRKMYSFVKKTLKPQSKTK